MGCRRTLRVRPGGRSIISKSLPPEMDHDAPVAVHCKGGYRSMIASSLLQRAGFKHVVNVIGGFDAWQDANLPVAREKPVEV